MDFISDRLVEIKSDIPVEFARKTRSLAELSRYKATELRLLLLYILPVVLAESDFPPQIHHHFLLFHCAIRCLSVPSLVSHLGNIEFVRARLVEFVESCITIYGEKFVPLNIHNLIHLPDEVIKFGALLIFSCFPFEDHLQKLIGLVRRCRNPLQQLAKRILEMRNNPLERGSASRSELTLLKPRSNGPIVPQLLRGNQYSEIRTPDLLFNISHPNNCAVLNTGEPIVIENFVKNANNEIFVVGRKFLDVDDLYNYPFSSRRLGICVAKNLSGQLEAWNWKAIQFKAIKIKMRNKNGPQNVKFAVLSLLHT